MYAAAQPARRRPLAPGMGAGISDVASSLSSLGRSTIRSVTFRSALSPTATFTGSEIWGPGTQINTITGQPASPADLAKVELARTAVSQGRTPPVGTPVLAPVPSRSFGFTDAFMRIAKPEVQIDTPIGQFSVAPYGRPRVNYFWPVMILGTASLVALTALAVKGARCRC